MSHINFVRQLAIAWVFVVPSHGLAEEAAENAVGVRGHVGCHNDAKRVERLIITKSGLYENYLVDGAFRDKNLVKIQAPDVTLRNCEIRNGRDNGIVVSAANVVIENCKLHHLLKGTMKKQQDAHGITGRPDNLVIRNCQIFNVSGDAVQFDPGRNSWNDVEIHHCTFASGPLLKDAAGFLRGESPGENAIDTKQHEGNPRSRMLVQDCLLYGWRNGPISNQAALNLKDHVAVTVVGCVLADNEIAFRLRGDTGKRGGALVTIRDCAVYRSDIAVRLEDKISNLKIYRLGIGEGVQREFQTVGGRGEGFENVGQYQAPSISQAISAGLRPADEAPPPKEKEERAVDP